MWTFVTENEAKTGALANIWGRSIGPGLERKGGWSNLSIPKGECRISEGQGNLDSPLIHPPPDTGLVRDPLNCCCLFGASPTPARLSLAGCHTQRVITMTNPSSVKTEQTWSEEIHFHSPIRVESTRHKPVVQPSFPYECTWDIRMFTTFSEVISASVEERLVVVRRGKELAGWASPTLCLRSDCLRHPLLLLPLSWDRPATAWRTQPFFSSHGSLAIQEIYPRYPQQPLFIQLPSLFSLLSQSEKFAKQQEQSVKAMAMKWRKWGIPRKV